MECPIRPNSRGNGHVRLCNAQTDFRKLIHPVTLLKGIIIQHKTCHIPHSRRCGYMSNQCSTKHWNIPAHTQLTTTRHNKPQNYQGTKKKKMKLKVAFLDYENCELPNIETKEVNPPVNGSLAIPIQLIRKWTISKH